MKKEKKKLTHKQTNKQTKVEQFSKIMHVQVGVAKFFLEASNWSVESAVHAFLASGVADGNDEMFVPSQLPQVQLVSDLSGLNSTVFLPNTTVEMVWIFKNTGLERWPNQTSIVHLDGELMQGLSSIEVASASPGEMIRVKQTITTPSTIGTFAGTWSFACPTGYFGDPIWIIITTGGGNGSSQV